jgi:hypothetical protein
MPFENSIDFPKKYVKIWLWDPRIGQQPPIDTPSPSTTTSILVLVKYLLKFCSWRIDGRGRTAQVVFKMNSFLILALPRIVPTGATLEESLSKFPCLLPISKVGSGIPKI